MIDDDVLGKAYDGRLMRRLLTYLRPYRGQVTVAVAAIIGHSALDLAPPYLTKIVIDRYIPAGDLAGLGSIAALYLAALIALVPARVRCRHGRCRSSGSGSCSICGCSSCRICSGSICASTTAIPVGRLMTRVTTDVDVLNELFTSGVVSVFGDVFTLHRHHGRPHLDGLAPGAGRVLGAAAHRRSSRSGSAVNVRESYRTVRTWIARINAYPPGAHHRHGDGAAVSPRAAGLRRRSTRSTAQHRDANVQSIFYYAVFYPAIELVGALAASLILWVGGGASS